MVIRYQTSSITASIEKGHGHTGRITHSFLYLNCFHELYIDFQPKREAVRKIAPIVTVSSEITKSTATESTVVVRASRDTKVFINQTPVLPTIIPKIEKSLISELDWDLSLEYDPMHPSDYDKITKGLIISYVFHNRSVIYFLLLQNVEKEEV